MKAYDSDNLGYNIILAAGILMAQSNAPLRATAGINLRQFMALRTLHATPDLGSGELARHLLISPQSCGAMLDGLERLRYVQRAGAPGEKMRVRLTGSGQTALDHGEKVIAGLEHQHEQAMAPGESSQLNRLLQTLLRTLDGCAPGEDLVSRCS